MKEDEKNEHEEIEEILSKISELITDKEEGTLESEGFRVVSSLEEAKAFRDKLLSEQRERIERRKRLKEDGEKQKGRKKLMINIEK